MKKLNDINNTIKKDIIVENLMISNGVYLLVSHPKVGKVFHNNISRRIIFSFYLNT